MKKIITLSVLMALVFSNGWGQATNYSVAPNTGNTLTTMTGSTSLISTGVDDGLGTGTLPFSFTFAGTTYNANSAFKVSSNGFFTFSSTLDPQSNNSLSSSTVYPIIAPLWDDFTTGNNGGVSYIVTGSVGSRKLTIQWQVNNYASGASVTSAISKTFQLWLFEGTNVIQFVYGSFNNAPPSATVGIASSLISFQSISTSSNSVSTSTSDNSNSTIPVNGSGYIFTPVKNWIGYGAGGTSLQTDFNAATNWSPIGAPAATDNLVMNITVATVSPTITLSSASTTVNSLTVTTSQSGNPANARTFILSTNGNTFTITNALTFTSAATGNGSHSANFNVTGGTTTVGSISTNTSNAGGTNSSVNYGLLFNISSGATLIDNGNLTVNQTDGGGNAGYITDFNCSGIFTIQGSTLANSNGSGGEVQFSVDNSPATINFNGNAVFDDGTTASTDAIYIGSTAAAGNNTTGTMNFRGNVSVGSQAGSLINNIHGKTVFDAATSQTVTINSTLGMYFPSIVVGSANSPTVTFAGSANASISASAPTPISLSINNSSVLDLASNTLNLSSGATSTIAIASGAKLRLAGSTGGQTTSNFPLRFSNYSFNNNSTVEYYGTGAQKIFSTPSYGNLTLTNASIKSAGGSLTVNGNVTINSGSTFDVTITNYAVSVAGNWINSGSFTQRSGTVTFNGTSLQSVSGSTTFYNLTVSDNLGTTFVNAAATAQTVTNVLTLTNGIVTTTLNNTLSVSNTATTAISGGSTASFINGPINRTLPQGLSLSSNVYNFPVGSGTTYLPFSATSLTTNSSVAPILLVQVFGTSAGGTGDNVTLSTNGSLSTTEYWQTGLLNSSTSGISQGIVSLTRQTAVSPYNVVATTANLATGKYVSKGGTPSGNSIINSNSLADFANQFYVLAQTPLVSVSSVINPTSINSCFGFVSSNMALSLSGAALINGVTVTPPAGFEISLSSAGTFSSSVTLGSGGTLSSTPVYIRLKASDAVGSYSGNITLTSTNATLPVPAILTSNVQTTPTASITPASSSACAGTAVSVTISGTAGASIGYNLNSGTTITGTLPVSSFNTSTNAGTYTYKLTSVTLAGCPGTFTNNTAAITIQALPTVSSITGGAYVQTNNTLQLSDATSGGVWSTDNTATGNVSTAGLVTGVAEGTPTITYKVTDATSLHCQNQVTQAIRVYNPDYITQASGNFSTPGTWEIDRDDNTFVTSVAVPAGSNYTSIRVQNALTLDQDFQVGTNTSFSLITGGTMNISPNKTLSSLGSVDFGSKAIIVKSDATGTGAIGQMASNILNANNVQVERFIGSTSFATGRRAWRLLTSPLSDATINTAWQEGLVSNTNSPTVGNTTYGTLITGYGQATATNAFNHGYDFWNAIAYNTSSIRYYVPGTVSGLWNSLTTLTNVKIADQPAYMLFVRGNRSVLSTGFGITTLRAKGTLQQGTFSTSVSGSNIYTLVGNPFAAPLDFDKIYSASTNIKSQFLVWNSQNGNYGAYTLVIRNGNNSYNIVPNVFNSGTSTASTSAQYIVSGEGFLVQPLSSAGGTVVINDQAKTSLASVGINPYRLSPDTDKKLYVNLNLKNSDTSVTLADGFLVRFDATYDTAVNEDDAFKQSNFNENLGILRQGDNLIVEARPDVVKTDTVQMKLWNIVQRAYQFQIKAENFTAPTLHAFLEDSYLQTKQEVALSGSVSSIDFTVNSDTASYSATRFRIVFQNDAAALPVTLTSVKAAVQNAGVNVSWTVTNEVNINHYTVQRSADGGRTYVSLGNVGAKNTAGAAFSNYQSLDAQPLKGDNLYRIAIEGNDGKITYSSVVKVTIGTDADGVQITLYPNPVKPNGKVNLQLTNLATGAYLVNVYSQAGQTVYQKKITIAQDNVTQNEEVKLSAALAQGSYQLRLTDSKGAVIYTDKLIVGK